MQLNYFFFALPVIVTTLLYPISSAQAFSNTCQGNQTCTVQEDLHIDVSSLRTDLPDVNFQIGTATIEANHDFIGYIKIPSYGSGENIMNKEPSGNGWFVATISNYEIRNVKIHQDSYFWPYESYSFQIILGTHENVTSKFAIRESLSDFSKDLAYQNVWNVTISPAPSQIVTLDADHNNKAEQSFTVHLTHTLDYIQQNQVWAIVFLLLVFPPVVHLPFRNDTIKKQGTTFLLVVAGQLAALVAMWQYFGSITKGYTENDHLIAYSILLYLVAFFILIMIKWQKGKGGSVKLLDPKVIDNLGTGDETTIPGIQVPLQEELIDASIDEIQLSLRHIKEAHNDLATRTAWQGLDELARKRRIFSHEGVWNILKETILVDYPGSEFGDALSLLKRMLNTSITEFGPRNNVVLKSYQLFGTKFRQILNSTDPKWDNDRWNIIQILDLSLYDAEKFNVYFEIWKNGALAIKDDDKFMKYIGAIRPYLTKAPIQFPNSVRDDLFKIINSTNKPAALRASGLLQDLDLS